MQKNTKEQYQYTQNRELSWLRFNKRVLQEASDKTVPILERLKFISIFSSNLDEFFMVRVGSIFDLAHMTPDDKDSNTGWTPEKQLHHIYRAIPELLDMKQEIYGDVNNELAKSGIRDVSYEDLNSNELKQVNRFFKKELLPILSPILIGPNHPVPHLVNKNLYVVALLENKKDKKAIGIVPVPDNISPYLLLSNSKRFIRTENIILRWLPTFFDAYNVKESCILAATRNADISFDDEKFDDNEVDFRHQMKKLLKKRDYLSVVRLELNKQVSKTFQSLLLKMAKVETHQVFIDSCPLNMHYVYKLIDDLPKDLSNNLQYKPHHPRWANDLIKDQSIIQQIKLKDSLLFYPYDSVEPFSRLLNEAADDPKVLSIKITIYRLASSSKIAQILCRAAEKGKEVLVLMELRARFDEENNLSWAKMLEESGCQVIYGTEGFKCHSKICLITLRGHNKTNYITQIGTGNYNEKTNALYTDLCYMTSNAKIGEDASMFFRNMLVNKLDGEYHELCVSPLNIKKMLLKKIDEQMLLGKEGFICIKANSVTDREVIDRLAMASRAGVEIQLIIRGICCILPNILGDTENIHITSIVGRYLEHARIYMFGKGVNYDIYISSADLMTRNLNHRVEIACPIYDEHVKEELKWILETQLRDSAKASFMLSDGSYSRKFSEVPFDSQDYFINNPFKTSIKEDKNQLTLCQKIRKCFIKAFKTNS